VFWGFLLGTGVATLIPYSAFLILIGVELSAGVPVAMLCGLVFGGVRSASVMLPYMNSRYRREPAGIMRLLPRLRPYANILNYVVIVSGFLTVGAIMAGIG
jgi:hypothetical protein